MGRHFCRNLGLSPTFRFSEIVRTNARLTFGLVLVCSHLGCAASSPLKRVFALNPLRPSNSIAKSNLSESAKTRNQDSDAVGSNSEILLTNAQSDTTSDGSQANESANNSTLQSQLTAGDDQTVPSGSQNSSTTRTVSLNSSSVTLAELEAIALQNNPTLLQAQAAVWAEQGLYRQAGMYPNPQVGYFNGSASNPGVKSSNGLFLSQEFVMGRKLQLAQQTAAVETERYQFDYESQRMRVLNDLKIRYYEVIGAQEAKAMADRMVSLAEKGLETAQNLHQAGTIPQSELNNTLVQLETVYMARDEAEHRHSAAWRQLATMIGESPMAPVPLVGDLTKDIPELDEDLCWQELLNNSPQLQSNQRDLGHAWATYREEVAKPIPNITVQTVGEYDRVTQSTTFSTLVALPLPIFNGNQGNIDKASADICANEAEIRRVQLLLREQLADSFKKYKTNLGHVERLQKIILPSREQNLDLAMKLFEGGQTSQTPILSARQDLFQSQMAYVDALTELHKVVTEIQGLQLTGGLNPAAIGSAIQSQPGGGGAQRQRNLLGETQTGSSKQLLNAASISQ